MIKIRQSCCGVHHLKLTSSTIMLRSASLEIDKIRQSCCGVFLLSCSVFLVGCFLVCSYFADPREVCAKLGMVHGSIVKTPCATLVSFLVHEHLRVQWVAFKSLFLFGFAQSLLVIHHVSIVSRLFKKKHTWLVQHVLEDSTRCPYCPYHSFDTNMETSASISFPFFKH